MGSIGVITISICSMGTAGTDTAMAAGIMQRFPRKTCAINPMIVPIFIIYPIIHQLFPSTKKAGLSAGFVVRLIITD